MASITLDMTIGRIILEVHEVIKLKIMLLEGIKHTTMHHVICHTLIATLILAGFIFQLSKGM